MVRRHNPYMETLGSTILSCVIIPTYSVHAVDLFSIMSDSDATDLSSIDWSHYDRTVVRPWLKFLEYMVLPFLIYSMSRRWVNSSVSGASYGGYTEPWNTSIN